MARTSISIPDDLRAKLGNYKNRINISAVCTKALRRAVENERLLEEHALGLQEAIARLRAQRLESDASWNAGYRKGVAWVLGEGDYAEIMWFIDAVVRRVDDGVRAFDIVKVERPALQKQAMPTLEAMVAEHDPVDFWAGFVQAVCDLWEQIGDAVESDGEVPPRSGRR